jgi:hypothetical protein
MDVNSKFEEEIPSRFLITILIFEFVSHFDIRISDFVRYRKEVVLALSGTSLCSRQTGEAGFAGQR